jgi:hypothetical protein
MSAAQVKDRVIFPLPLDAYELTPLDNLNIELAISTLDQSCLKRFGFNWDLSHWPKYTPTGDEAQPGYRPTFFGINVTDNVAVYGYGIPPNPVAQAGQKTAAEMVKQYPQVMWNIENGALSGDYGGVEIPDGGCLGEARRAFYGENYKSVTNPNILDFGNTTDVAQQLQGEAAQRALQDSRLKNAFATWSACMGANGYQYKSPLDPENANPNSGVATSADIAMAKTDLACRQRQNLVGLWYAVQIAYENQAIEKYATQLAEVKASNGALVRKAASMQGR